MKTSLVILIVSLLSGNYAVANPHPPSHVKHNMLLFGQREIFASHLVYKRPHNYQVVLQLNLHPEVVAMYAKQRIMYPNDELRYLLDEMEIKNIGSSPFISGDFIRKSQAEQVVVFLPNVKLSRSNFKLIYLSEIPIAL